MEGQNDVVLGNSSFKEVRDDAMIKTVVVEPNLVLANLSIKNQAMNPLLTLPTFCNHEIAVLRWVNEETCTR